MDKNYNTQKKLPAIFMALRLKYLIAISALLTGCIAANAQAWNIVGSPDFSTADIEYPSMAIDNNGTVYVAYKDFGNGQKASVMKFNGATWEYVGAPGFSPGTVLSTSIAIDTGGTPYVAFVDIADSDKATVMKYTGGSWVTVGSRGFTIDSAEWTVVQIDRHGAPYVSYEYEGLTKVATVMKFDGADWVTVGAHGFTEVFLGPPGFALDSGGTPYIVFADSVGAKAEVMKFDGSSWVSVGTPGFSVGEAYYPSIAINDSGAPYVAYADAAYAMSAVVMKYNGSSWVSVGTSGFSAGAVGTPSIKINSSGVPFVGFEDFSLSDKATVMEYNGSSWVDAGSPGFSAAGAVSTILALDACGTPYIVYEDESDTGKATVMMLSPAPVSGMNPLCAGDTATFSDISCYGAWSSSNTGVAAIDSNTGIVIALAAGTANISYTVSGVSTIATVTVNTTPSAGVIDGVNRICPGDLVLLSETVTGGTWLSVNTGVAIVTGSGYASGITSGQDTIVYVTSNSCGSDSATFAITVIPIDSCPSSINSRNISVTSFVFFPNPTHGSFTLNVSSPSNEEAQITFTNILGEKIKEFSIPTNKETEVQLDAPPGVYFISVVTKNETMTAKIILQ